MINNLNDVKALIAKYPTFFITNRPPFIFASYLYVNPAAYITNPDLCEIRGICFNEDGTVAQRKLHKFFNFGESACAATLNNIKYPLTAYTKYDGSLLSIIYDPLLNRYVYHTELGHTDVACKVEKELPIEKMTISGKPLVAFVEELAAKGQSPMFEYISPYNQIVLMYPETRLMLLMARNKNTGAYDFSYQNRAPEKSESKYEICAVHIAKTINNAVDFNTFIEQVKRSKGIEGFVVWDAEGKAFKLKSDEYFAYHKVVYSLVSESTMWDLILNKKIDDILPRLPIEFKVKVENYRSALTAMIAFNVTKLSMLYDTLYKQIAKEHLSRKDVVLNLLPTYKVNHFTRSLLLKLLYGTHDTIAVAAADFLKQRLLAANTQTKRDSIAKELKLPRWTCQSIEES